MNIPDSKRTKHTIWFDEINHPTWWEGTFAIGNGRIGASSIGHPEKEIITLNENGIWANREKEQVNTAALAHLEEIRELIKNGENDKAQFLADYTMLSNPHRNSPYQPFGELNLSWHYPGKGEVSDYSRSLDLETAVSSVLYSVDGGRYFREAFASYPAQTIAFRFAAEKEGSLSFGVRLSRYIDASVSVHDEHTLKLTGKAGRWGTEFAGFIRAECTGGSLSVQADSILFLECENVILYYTASSEFHSETPEVTAFDTLEKASAKGYDSLKSEHIEDFRSMYDRVSLSIDGEDDSIDIPTPKRLDKIKEGGEDRGIEVLMFNLGRYFLISSSRSAPGALKSLPSNLQGIWNPYINPPWESDLHININLQMNYWLAGPIGLSECEKPLNEWMHTLAEKGKLFAKEHYNCKGWVAHHLSNPWGHAGPADHSVGLWPTGGAWMCLHLWEHFAFTGDEDFLKETAYPLMRGACDFFLDYLFEEEIDGQTFLLCGPSMSPENRFHLPGRDGEYCLSIGTTMDNMILRELFGKTAAAASILGVDDSFIKEAQKTVEKLPPTKIGKYGQVMEWLEDYEEAEPGHRHISQLFGLHPVFQITPYDTPELAEAARKTITRRLESGGGHTGWSLAWLINMFARLHDGKEAHETMLRQLRDSTLPNLWDTHPPFQIDGNFGYTAGVCEMLLQSNEHKLFILPALPPAWKKGQLKGLKARGGLAVDIFWENGKPSKCSIHALEDGEWTIHSELSGVTSEGNPIDCSVLGNSVKMTLEKQKKYNLIFK